MSDLESLKEWIKKVREIKGWPDAGEWTNHHCQILSEEINLKTGIQISRTAFKKIIENILSEKKYSPQAATRNALAKYIGFESWEDFKNSTPKKQRNLYPIKIGVIVLGVVIIALISYLWIFNKTSYEFDFSIENPTGTIPHTLTCKYDISKLNSDDIKIDYGHVNHRNKYTIYELNKTKNVHKECFHHPGRYNVRVFIDEQVHFKERVWVNTNGWYI